MQVGYRAVMASKIEELGLYFEDFYVNQTWETPAYLVRAEELLDYAQVWDPLPIHTDVAAATASPHGGLIASGEHTFAIMRRMLWDLGVTSKATRIVEQRELRFLAPTRINDRVTIRARCTDLQRNQSPDIGLVTLEIEAINQSGIASLRCTDTLEVLREPRNAAR